MSIVQIWRITDKNYADSAFSGEGARLWGGRFNSPGTPAVYASGSLSLALLEILVQTNDRSNLKKKILFRVEIPAEIVHAPPPDKLPKKWNNIPVSKDSQFYGDRWISEKIYPVLRVPSVVVPQEYNYLINPLHNLVRKISFPDAQPLPVDPRFFDIPS